jgi:hypothetical protein
MMTFKEVLSQAVAWLQQDKRVSYRALQRQFVLDDTALADLQDAILYTYPQVSRVRRLLATPSRDEEFYTSGAPFLVGREEESGLLRRRWEQSKAGLGQVVLVSGEAGIGKSALVEGLRAQVCAEGLPCLTFRCSPYHTIQCPLSCDDPPRALVAV